MGANNSGTGKTIGKVADICTLVIGCVNLAAVVHTVFTMPEIRKCDAPGFDPLFIRIAFRVVMLISVLSFLMKPFVTLAAGDSDVVYKVKQLLNVIFVGASFTALGCYAGAYFTDKAAIIACSAHLGSVLFHLLCTFSALTVSQAIAIGFTAGVIEDKDEAEVPLTSVEEAERNGSYEAIRQD